MIEIEIGSLFPNNRGERLFLGRAGLLVLEAIILELLDHAFPVGSGILKDFPMDVLVFGRPVAKHEKVPALSGEAKARYQS